MQAHAHMYFENVCMAGPKMFLEFASMKSLFPKQPSLTAWERSPPTLTATGQNSSVSYYGDQEWMYVLGRGREERLHTREGVAVSLERGTLQVTLPRTGLPVRPYIPGAD